MVVDMDHQEIKNSLLEMEQKKKNIESYICLLKTILRENNIGMKEPLVDAQGYPRTDINVYQVRCARNKIICLMNDHRSLMERIEQGLHKYHELTGAQQPMPNVSMNIQKTEMPESFLRVNLVSPDSPAETAGIQVEDLILEFGSINCQNFKSLTDIQKLVENSKHKQINVKIKRGSNVIILSLIPHPWNGIGLLGCNVVPLEVLER